MSDQLKSIRASLAYLKSDDIVDDDACENIFNSIHEITRISNLLMAGSEVPAIELPEPLPSYYEEDE